MQQVARRLLEYGAKRTADGNYRCVCGSEFVGVTAAQQCARCWLHHGLETLDGIVATALPASSLPGLGGRWLGAGEECAHCGSTAAGWICDGSSGHMASCEEALLFQGKWTSLRVDRRGVLQVDRRKHCVHVDGSYKTKDEGLAAITAHLHAHHCACQHYQKRMGRWLRLARVERQPVLLGKLKARAGPAPLAFQSRIRAFQRTGEAIPADSMLDRLLFPGMAATALNSIEQSGVVLRRGSVVLPDADSDGLVILKIDNKKKMAQTALVSRNDQCARHPLCVCYHICENIEQKWRKMTDIIQGGRQVVCLCPRFGWKHDFSLPLSKVCWRRASPDATKDIPQRAVRRPASNLVGDQVGPADDVSMRRCAKLLDLCRTSKDLECFEYEVLRCLGCKHKSAHFSSTPCLC